MSLAHSRHSQTSRKPSTVMQALPFVQGLPKLVAKLPGMKQPAVVHNSQPIFTQWLQKHGYAVDKEKVVITQLERQGRGLVTSAPVQKQSLLLAVPKDLIIFPQTAAEASCLAPLIQQQNIQLPDWSLLALFLAEQRYLLAHMGDSSSSSSRWGPYIQLLPQGPVGTVLDWTDLEVATLLAGSGLLAKAHTIRSAADSLWQDLQPLINSGRQQGLCQSDTFSRLDIQWAVGICLSRSVRLDDMAGEPIVLVPFADFLNHDVTCQAYLVWDEQQQAVVLRPDRRYEAGQQVFVSYGPKSSGELLLSYGFCPAPGSNPHDAAHINLSIPSTDRFKQAKEQALAAHGIPSDETFAVRIDALPAGLIPYLAFCSAEVRSSGEVEDLAALLFAESQLPAVHGVSCEQLALAALSKHCRALLQKYPQNQEVDRQLAASVPGGGGYEQRQALMASIRVRERQILSRTEFVAQQRVRELKKSR